MQQEWTRNLIALSTIANAQQKNQVFGLKSKSIEDERFEFFYAHENSMLIERTKFVLMKLKCLNYKTDVNELYTGEKMSTN